MLVPLLDHVPRPAKREEHMTRGEVAYIEVAAHMPLDSDVHTLRRVRHASYDNASYDLHHERLVHEPVRVRDCAALPVECVPQLLGV